MSTFFETYTKKYVCNDIMQFQAKRSRLLDNHAASDNEDESDQEKDDNRGPEIYVPSSAAHRLDDGMSYNRSVLSYIRLQYLKITCTSFRFFKRR